jgi:DNA helicase-2/ATP-dependent DNA helicase PcrA
MSEVLDIEAGLNEAQRRAVRHSNGPLAVLAGPGTGKTRVITHRIARLLIEDQAEPATIVALTFTNRAAAQMRERLEGLLPDDLRARAQDVRAMTFHSFGQRLLRRYGDLGGYDAHAQLIDGAQRRRLLRELVRTHGLYPDGVGAGVDAAVERAERLIEQMSNHAITIAQAREHARAWRDRVERNSQALDDLDLAGERARLERFEVLVELSAAFSAACRERGWMCFGDLVTLPIELVRANRLARDLIRSEIRHMVVDEFQDVNPAQIALVRELMPASIAPDLCVVGDDDQTIYEFRGADERAFAKFVRHWPGAGEVRLEENHRSAQCILDVSNAVIARASDRFAPDKSIKRPASKLEQENGAIARAIHLAKYHDDAELIASLLLEMKAGEPERPWSKYAVLARGHGDLERVATALDLEGIPCVRARVSGVEPGVQDVLAYIRALMEPSDIYAVRRILTRPPSLLPVARVGEWEREYRVLASHADSGNPDVAAPGTYIEFLARTQAGEPCVSRMLEHLDELGTMSASRLAGDVVARIVELSAAAHAELLDPRARARRVQALAEFMRMARERADRFEPPGLLAQFWDYYNDLSEREQEGVSASEQVEGLGEHAHEHDGVQLITAHSCKGLEFDTVFVTRVQPSHGFGHVKVDDDSELPEELIDRAGDKRGPRERASAEQRRLFYVACTRAERRLVLMGEVPKSSSSAHYLRELVEPGGVLTLERGAEALERAARSAVGEAQKQLQAIRGLRSRREVIERLRAQAREQAARALDAADRPQADAECIARASARLEQSAVELAILHALAKGYPAPALSPQHAPLIEAIERELASAGQADLQVGSAAGLKPPAPPLALSYSMVNDWNRCPRCCYCKYVLKLPAPPSQEAAVGEIVHEALATFYGRWMRADAEGEERPGTKELIELGRSAYFRARRQHTIDRHDLLAIDAMLRAAHEKFHDPEAHILEHPEWKVDIDIELSCGKHRLTTKIDRVEQLRTGGVRIVDYKTGKPHKTLVEPKNDDLQMGTYALALDARLGDGQPVSGTAEYWVLSTGQRGVIDLATIKREKVRKTLDEVATGMLSGQYPKGEKCEGHCDFLG